MQRTFADGRFEVLRTLGSGGTGEVYEVLDREQGVTLALKQLRDFSPQALLQLKAEFRAVRDLNHPNLVALGELVVENGKGFFTMELVEGTDFLGYVRPPPDDPALARGAAMDQSTVELDRSQVPGLAGVLHGPGVPLGRPDALRARVDSSVGLNESRLRSALRQLSEALLALHGAGMVHRDVKPPNIRVTPEGRVVLLDFGLVALGAAETDRVLGTPLYMSPEQIQSAQVGPASDWYSVGMLLYHALAGRAPLAGSVKDLFLLKLGGALTPPDLALSNVPEDLNALCVDLLQRVPSDRPSGPQILARLGGTSRAEAVAAAPPFFGRAEELAQLMAVYRDLVTGTSVSLVIQGESGLGKTALARAFLTRVAQEEPAPLILSGRCHERESIPFKALDGVVDDIAESLSRLSAEDVRALVPGHAGLLIQAFPVLGRLKPFAEAGPAPRVALAPSEQRRRIFSSLRDLLAKLAEVRPVIIFLEDMQWADGDSLVALRAVLHPPGRPQAMVLATARGAREELWAPPPPYGLAALGADVEHLRLRPLSAECTHQLVASMLPAGSTMLGERAAALAQESGGHPLFVQELVIHLLSQTSLHPDQAFNLEEAIRARVGRLPVAPRTLLNLVVVAGSPLTNEVLADAAGLLPETYAEAVAQLRNGKLVRALGLKRQDRLEAFHGRIRDAVLEQLPMDERRPLHEQLARAVERRTPDDAETLAVHWQAAGDAPTALRHALEAAARAERNFAFDRGVRLRRLALQLAERPSPDESRALERGLAEALARAGQNAEAAEHFLAASKTASVDEAIQLKSLAAERSLLAGDLRKGLPQLRETLSAVGVPWRRGSSATLVAILGLRVRLKLRGLRYRQRVEAEVPPALLLQVDILGACSAPLTFIDVLGASYYNVRYVLAALEAGEAGRLARAFAVEFTLYSALHPNDEVQSQRLLAEAESLALAAGSPPSIRVFLLLQRTICAFTRDGDLDATLALSVEGERVARNEGAGGAWELSALEQFANFARYCRGEWRAMRSSVLQNLAEAEERGDTFGIACASTASLNVTWLMGDAPDEARRRIALATERYPRDRTYIIHLYEVLAHVNVDLYVGDAATAFRRIDESWKPLSATWMQQVPMIAYLMWELRGRTAIALAAQRTGTERKRLLQEGRLAAGRVARTRFAWGSAVAQLQLAAAAAVEGRIEEAIERLSGAEARFLASKAGLFFQLARFTRGKLLGGEGGRMLVAASIGVLTGEGIVAPERMVRALGPLI